MRWWTYPQVMAASAVSMPHGSWAGEHERKSLIYCAPVAELLRAHATKLRRIFTWAAKVTGKLIHLMHAHCIDGLYYYRYTNN